METIGDILKTARMRRGLTIEELQQSTKIQKRHLVSIEKNDFEALPGPYYARTFIRQYAAEVGVDGSYLISMYEGDKKPAVNKETPLSTRTETSIEKPVNRNVEVVKSNLPLAVLFFSAVLIILGIGYFTLKDGNDQPMITPPKEIVTETKVEDEKTKETSKETEEEKEPKEKNTESLTINYLGTEGYASNFSIANVEKDIDLELEAVNETCWVGIQVNGEYVHDEMLEPGKKSSYTFKDKPATVAVVVGNVSNMKVKMNGKDVDYNPEKEVAVKKDVNFSITYK
ncbi:helix-turn-helix domain-containing protein [Vagococcus coleopterorum]|uniref:Helix-turn-helix domain-containing protein n=1 Tax=Vagococcus coleopterorum TaxID=2714946 RepID=A0A6G8ALV0_9ENTE|nr:helix-turn-helix domain-containing protein [Vagococcus coleopterorum]QIL45905.1 helix-turn-helix domain-containing protein [Vagococcus coleopterorum]